MNRKTSAGRGLEAMDGREYDAPAKVFLSERQILVRIMKGCVEEYTDCSIEAIENEYMIRAAKGRFL